MSGCLPKSAVSLTECLKWCMRCRNTWGLFLIWWHLCSVPSVPSFTSGGLSALCSLIFILVYFLEGCSDLGRRRRVRWRGVPNNPWACLWKSLESGEGPSKKKSGKWTNQMATFKFLQCQGVLTPCFCFVVKALCKLEWQHLKCVNTPWRTV